MGAPLSHFHGRGRNGKWHLQRRFLRKRGAAGKALLGASRLNPLRHGLRRATSPERGRFCSTCRKVPKSSPKGTPFGAAAKFPAIAKAVPLGKVA